MNYNDEPYRQMLACFRTNDLQNLLGTFGCSKAGRKSELKDRALELLRNRPVTFNIKAYLSRISEIYRNMQIDAANPNLMQNTMQQANTIMTMRLQDNPQRYYTPPPQYSQSTMQMTRAGLPQVMPQIPRGIYANNNYPYGYQPNGPRRIISQVPTNSPVNIVLGDPRRLDIALHPGNSNNAISTQPPPPPSLGNIKFKKLPFFELVGEVIKPTNLIGQERCSLQNVTKGMRETSFKFTMLPEHATQIAMNRDISNPAKVEYTYIMQIRICLLNPGATELTDFLPLGLHIRVGNKSCQLPPSAPNVRPGTEARRIPRPISISHGLKLNPTVTNSITINWIPDGKNYVLGMSLVKKLSSEILLQRLKEKGARSSKETKKYIIKKLADVDPDLATTSYRVSLMCPLGKMRMKIPAKSVNCDHLQCFDASIYILMNEKKPTWLCPTCNKPCAYDDIQIENYFLEVVTSPNLSPDGREIEILADGTWRVYEDPKDTEASPTVKETPIDSVTLDDSDEEISEVKIEPRSDPNPESSKVPANFKESENSKEPEHLKSSFVDLTLSDDDEGAPRGKVKQENEAQAVDTAQPVAVVRLKPQAQVQPQQAVTSSEQGVVIEVDSPSPPTSPTPSTSAS